MPDFFRANWINGNYRSPADGFWEVQTRYPPDPQIPNFSIELGTTFTHGVTATSTDTATLASQRAQLKTLAPSVAVAMSIVRALTKGAILSLCTPSAGKKGVIAKRIKQRGAPKAIYPYTLPLVNGDWETGDATGWTTIFGGPPGLKLDAAGAHGGSYYGFGGTVAKSWWGQTFSLGSDVTGDVDNGNLTVTWQSWRTGFATDSDAGQLLIECFDGGGVLLGARQSSVTDPAAWTLETLTMRVPPLARTIRVSTRSFRASGVNNDAYYDDMSAYLDVADSSSALVYSNNGTGNTGWTVTGSGSTLDVQSIGSWPYSVLTGLNGTQLIATRDVAVPSGFTSSIDAYGATLEIRFEFATAANGTDSSRVWFEAIDGSNNVLGTLAQTAAGLITQTNQDFLEYFTSVVPPPGTRYIRINFRADATVGDPDGYLTRLSVLIYGGEIDRDTDSAVMPSLTKATTPTPKTATTTPSATVWKGQFKILSPSTALAAAIRSSVAHTVAASVALTSAIVRSLARTLNPTSTPAPSIVRSAARSTSSSVAVAAALVRAAAHAFNSSTTPTSSISRAAAHVVSASSAAATTISRAIAHVFSRTAAAIADLSGSLVGGGATLDATGDTSATVARQTSRSLAASSSLSATLLRLPGKVISASAQAAASIVRSTAHPITVSVQLGVAIARSIARRVSATGEGDAAVNRIKAVNQSVSSSSQPSPAVSPRLVLFHSLSAIADTAATARRAAARSISAVATAATMIGRSLAKTSSATSTAAPSIVRASAGSINVDASAEPSLSAARMVSLALNAAADTAASLLKRLGRFVQSLLRKSEVPVMSRADAVDVMDRAGEADVVVRVSAADETDRAGEADTVTRPQDEVPPIDRPDNLDGEDRDSDV